MTPLCLYDLLRDRGHVLVFYADSADALTACCGTAAAADRLTGGKLTAFLVAPGDADTAKAIHLPSGANGRRLTVFRDDAGEFAGLYGAKGAAAFLIRPDGCLAARLTRLAAAETQPAPADALGRVFRL